MVIDLENFRYNSEVVVIPPKKSPPQKIKGWFLKGPIPGNWLEIASRLPGRTFHVAMALWYMKGRTKKSQVKLTHATLRKFGTEPDAGRRGLDQLERAGLVAVEQETGKAPLVTILDAPEIVED